MPKFGELPVIQGPLNPFAASAHPFHEELESPTQALIFNTLTQHGRTELGYDLGFTFPGQKLSHRLTGEAVAAVSAVSAESTPDKASASPAIA